MSLKLHCVDVGSSDEVILFLHGLGAHSHSWDEQIEFFKQAYRVIVPDLRGHGHSPLGNEDFSFELCADDIYHLLQELNIQKVHLCGFSLGGMIAFEFAVKYPEMLHSFCVINTLASFKLFNFKEAFAFNLRRVLIKFFPLRVLATLMSRKLFSNKDKALRKRLRDLSHLVNKKAYAIFLEAMPNWDLTQQLSFIKVPSVIIGSEFDYDIFKGKSELAESMPDAKFIEIKGCHHFVTWECADAFNHIYKDFITSV